MAVKRNKSRRPELKGMRPELTPLQQFLLKEADRKVTIVSDGREQEISIGEVVIRKQMQMAASGSVHASSNVANELNVAQRLRQRDIEEAVAFGRRIKQSQQALLDKTLKQGRNPDTVLPHPDDIHVIEGEGYKITGPIDLAELKTILLTCAKRDTFLIQSVLEERIVSQIPGPEEPSAGKSALLMVHFMNQGLPERFHKSDMQIIMEMTWYRRLSKRELLKVAHAAWASIGQPKPRGWIMPPYRRTVAMLEHVSDGCADLFGEIQSGKLVTEQAIAARIRRLVA